MKKKVPETYIINQSPIIREEEAQFILKRYGFQSPEEVRKITLKFQQRSENGLLDRETIAGSDRVRV
jgi:hypothetical protein